MSSDREGSCDTCGANEWDYTEEQMDAIWSNLTFDGYDAEDEGDRRYHEWKEEQAHD